MKIQGNLEDRDTAYWVEYDNGVWTETFGWEANSGLDASTLPHILVKTAPNTFEFREAVWGTRGAGDDESNPVPSFVGSTINNMFLFKGRLGFLSEENVILSEVGNLENFFRTTVIQSLDTELIDVATATGRVSTLYHTAAFSDELLLFSDKQQFRLTSGNSLSPETVGITTATAFPASTRVPPVVAGSSAFFVANGATNTVARELLIDGNSETVEGEDIAVQVPSYIPKNIRDIAVSNSADVFVTLSADEPNALYVYKWYVSQRRRIQSAWCKWEFDENVDIVGMGFLSDYLYIVNKVDGNVRIDRMLVGPVIDKDLLLDAQITQADFVSSTYSSGDDETTIVIPNGTPAVVEFYRTDADAFDPYTEATKTNDTTYVIPGDVTGHNIVAGLNYEWRYRFSNQYLREENGDGESAIQDGRLQLIYFSVIYTDTSYFEAHVTPTNGATKVTVFNGRTLADPDNITDLIPRDTGEFRFPVFAENEEVVIDLVSSQPYRCSIGSVEWTAKYKPKARRTGRSR